MVALAERTRATTHRMISEVRAAIAAEREGRQGFERLVDESRARERQLAKVLATLDGDASARPGNPGRPGAEGGVSVKRVARVLRVLVEAGTPLTVRQVMDRAEVGADATVRKALTVLCERGQAYAAGPVRVGSGIGSGQSARTYAALPAGDHDGG